MTSQTDTLRSPAQSRAAEKRARPWRRSKPVRLLAQYGVLIAVAAIFVGPFLVLLSTAFKPKTQELYGSPPDLIPRPPVLDAFVDAWTTIPFPSYLLNSVIYVVATVPLYLLISALTAYPLARIAFRGRSIFFLLFLSTMFLPGELMLIPRFLILSQLNLTDTFTGVILPALLSAVGIFLLRQTFAQIPDEIIEAARLDGCGDWRIFWRIAMPLARPTLAVLAILGFIAMWNSFIWPLIVLNDQGKYPLALGIAYLSGITGSEDRTLAAGTVLSLIPIVIVFVTLQKHILNSMSGAVKG